MMKRVTRRLLLAVFFVFSVQVSINAGPWFSPGDMSLRNDIQLLADAGVIKRPITTWPISVASIDSELEDSVDTVRTLNVLEQRAFARLQRRVQREKQIGRLNQSIHGGASRVEPLIRGFEDVARSDLELGASVDLMNDRFAIKLSPTLRDNADDGKNVTFDNSYIATILGNTIISAGYIDRWWGPGWQGSLIYGNNSRAIPGLSVQRNFVNAFEHPWLRWMGPWNYSITAGQLENARVVSDAYHLGMRFSFKPTKNLEFGVTRTAQWGGEGRPQTSDSLLDLLLGQDNIGSNGLTRDNEPGNQMAGFDVRWNQGLLPFDLTFYAQGIGEDEAGGLPSRFLGQVGFEHARRFRSGNLRLWLEYSDTACDFLESKPKLNCAYQNGIYQSGYRYYGRSIGHSIDGDGRNLTLGGIYTLDSGNYFTLQAQKLNLNRAPDIRHGVTTVPTDGHQVELSYNAYQTWGEIRVHVGHQAFDNSLFDRDGPLVGLEFKRTF